MKKLAVCIALSLALASCGKNGADNSNSADDFAARINGGQPNAQATIAPTVVEPLEGAAEGAFSPGTATDPQSAGCNANAMGEYIGREADEATRVAIQTAATSASEVRFIAPGFGYIRPDPTSPRLNMMLDNLGIIRDARCG